MRIPNRSLIIFMNIRGHYMGFRVKYKNDEASF